MSESVTLVIIFLTTVVVAAGLVGVFNYQVSLMESGALAKKSELEDRVAGGIEVVHVWASGDNLSVYVANVGGVPLDPQKSRVRINGEWVEPTSIGVVNPRGNELWSTGEVLEINLTAPLNTGWNSVAVLNSRLWTPEYRFRGG
ncbi:MAG: hypothetical protein GXO66_09635 [Euryarchaeota archaeon]|nr:hypothetical protein [Euryarchaeota archaeon]